MTEKEDSAEKAIRVICRSTRRRYSAMPHDSSRDLGHIGSRNNSTNREIRRLACDVFAKARYLALGHSTNGTDTNTVDDICLADIGSHQHIN